MATSEALPPRSEPVSHPPAVSARSRIPWHSLVLPRRGASVDGTVRTSQGARQGHLGRVHGGSYPPDAGPRRGKNTRLAHPTVDLPDVRWGGGIRTLEAVTTELVHVNNAIATADVPEGSGLRVFRDHHDHANERAVDALVPATAGHLASSRSSDPRDSARLVDGDGATALLLGFVEGCVGLVERNGRHIRGAAACRCEAKARAQRPASPRRMPLAPVHPQLLPTALKPTDDMIESSAAGPAVAC